MSPWDMMTEVYQIGHLPPGWFYDCGSGKIFVLEFDGELIRYVGEIDPEYSPRAVFHQIWNLAKEMKT